MTLKQYLDSVPGYHCGSTASLTVKQGLTMFNCCRGYLEHGPFDDMLECEVIYHDTRSDIFGRETLYVIIKGEEENVK